MHEMITTTVNLCGGVHWEVGDDTPKTSTMDLIKSQLTTMQGGAPEDIKGLSGVELEGDRAYSCRSFVEDIAVKAGAAISCTKSHSRDVPFTFGAKAKATEERTLLEENGAQFHLCGD